MPLIDISLSIAGDMLTWPGDPAVEIEASRDLASGGANVSQLRLGSHTGTHVDPPFHFIDGAPTVDELPIDALVGRARVLDLRDVWPLIEPEHLDGLDGVERVLFKTRNSELWTGDGWPAFPDEYVSLSVDGARFLAERGLRLVGTDFLSIERRGTPGHPTHVALLERGVVIVEGLALASVEPGDYELICMPLKIAGGDGAPARAVLRSEA